VHLGYYLGYEAFVEDRFWYLRIILDHLHIEGKEFSHHLELLNVLSSMMLGKSFMNILKRLGLQTRPV
jgi:hypothetical protein